MHPCLPLLAPTLCAARFLRSTGVTPLHHYYKPSRHRLVCYRLPGCAGYTVAPAPSISRWDQDGFSSCSACPGHRAAPNHPAGVTRRFGQIATHHAAFACPMKARPPDLFSFRGHHWVHLCCGPMTHSPPFLMALSIGFIRFVSSTDAIQVTGFLTVTLVGLSPTEHASLDWTHSGLENGFCDLGSGHVSLTNMRLSGTSSPFGP